MFPRHRQRTGRTALSRLHRHSPRTEILETRRLLSGPNLDSEPQISAYAGVGFALNPVTEIHGTKNGVTDNNPGDYMVSIDWGDGDSNDTSAKKVGLNNGVLVKASHNYDNPMASPGYLVTITVTGPDGKTTAQTTSVLVVLMPDVASQPPDPPTMDQGPQPLGTDSLTLDSEPQISAYAGVGFALNPVTQVHDIYNGSVDDEPSDYHAQINWGDGPTWDTNVGLTALGVTGVLVKGSHIYQEAGTYQVTLYVTGPDGQTISANTTSVFVVAMPEAASIPPDVPTSETGPQPLANESITLDSEPQISAYAGVGFALNPVTQVHDNYDGSNDNTTGDYQAQINWGDSPSWDDNVGLTALGVTGVLVKGSHIYQAPGTYQVVVYVTGPDGQTISANTTSVFVVLLPEAASRPPNVPTSETGPQPLANESITLDSEPQISAYAGVGFDLNPVTQVNDSYNGSNDITPGDYQAQINWGDSPSWDTNVGLTNLDVTGVLVKGSHIYQAAGTYQVVVYVTGPDGQTISANTTSVYVVQLPDAAELPPRPPAQDPGDEPLANETITLDSEPQISATEGIPFALSAVTEVHATYDGSVDDTPGNFDGQVEWGDSGQWDPNTTLKGAVDQGVLVDGTHEYSKPGPFQIVVDITGPDGQTLTANTTSVVVNTLQINASPVDFSVPEGTTYNGAVATFTVNAPTAQNTDFSASIDWGDGDVTTGTIVANSGGSGFVVNGSHPYADEQPSVPVTVTITATAAPSVTAIANSTANVTEADVLSAGSNPPISVPEGTALSGVIATFTDSGYPDNSPSDFTATINWGDGMTTSGTVAGGNGTFTVSGGGSHVYTDEGTHTIQVTLSDDAPGTATATASVMVTVTEADVLSAGSNPPLTVTEGDLLSGTIATFTDTGYPGNVPSDFTATINWGDGATTNGTVSGGNGTFTVSGSHTYADEGQRTIQVTLSDDAPGTATATAVMNVTVADAPLTASPVNFTTTEGMAFTGTVATFTDAYVNEPDGAADFTATINWGDGMTTNGTITAQGGGQYAVTDAGNHIYQEESATPYPVTVTIKDDGGSTATANSSATVQDAPLTAAGETIDATPGVAINETIATFTDADPSEPDGAEDFTATIDWGDGTTTAGTIAAVGFAVVVHQGDSPLVGSAGAMYTVSGMHTYLYGCATPITVNIKDDGGSTATATSTVIFPGITPLPTASPVAPNTPAPALNAGAWQAVGPSPVLNGQTPGSLPVAGRITGIATSPADPQTMYVATAGGGVWGTTNGGANWTPLTDNQPTLFMGAIALAPSNPSVIYAGTGEANGSGDSFTGLGVLVSTDAGAHWTLQNDNGLFTRYTISKIVVDPTNPDSVFVAVAGAGINGVTDVQNTGIYWSNDGGATWTNTTAASGLSTTDAYTDLAIDPANPQVVFAAIGTDNHTTNMGSAANGVYVGVQATIDGGYDWTRAGNFPAGAADGRISLAIAPSNPMTIYASIDNSATHSILEIMRSTDGGMTWASLTAPPNFVFNVGDYDSGLAVDPMNPNLIFAAGTATNAATNADNVIQGLVNPTTGVTTWTDVSVEGGLGPHSDNHALVFNSACQLLAGDDGGIFMLSGIDSVMGNTGNLTWTDLNGNLDTIQFYSVALDPTNPGIAYGGNQDNGTVVYSGNLNQWTETDGGDGSEVQVDGDNPQTIYHVLYSGASALMRSTDGGQHWTATITPPTPAAAVGSPTSLARLAVGPTNGARLLYGVTYYTPAAFNGYSTLYETTNATAATPAWTAIGTSGVNNFDPDNSVINAVAIAPSNPQDIYVAAGGHVFVTTDDGGHWAERDVTINSGGGTTVVNDSIAGIAIDPNNPLIAYVVRNAFDGGLFGDNGHVFMTTNGGVNWTDLTNNFPDVPAWSIVLDSRTTPARLFVGTDTGVYASTNDGTTWAPYMTGLPNVQVTSLVLNPTTNILAAGTHGRGLWEILVPATFAAPAPPAATGLAAASETGVNNQITRDNGATGAPLSFTVSGVSPASGFVQLYEVPSVGAPVPLGSPTQAVNGTATITLSATTPVLADGVYQFAATASVTPTSTPSGLSPSTSVTILTSTTIAGTNLPANGYVPGLSALGGVVTITFSHPLAGPNAQGVITALTSGGPALSSKDPYAVFLLQRGPSLAFAATSGIDGGNLPLHANTIYTVNPNGTSTITITPEEPLSSDVYGISVQLSAFTDLAGNTPTDPSGLNGFHTFLLQPPPTTSAALKVVNVTTYNGYATVNNSEIFQPDTFDIRFNKPLWQGAVNYAAGPNNTVVASNNVQLLADQNGTYTVQPSVATYSPATDSIYLTPTGTLSPGVLYIIRVSGAVSDDQGFSGVDTSPGGTLGTTYYNSFTVVNPPVAASSALLKVTATLPGNNLPWGLPLGYASATFTNSVVLSTTNGAFTRFSAMLDPRTTGSDGNTILTNIPLNAKLAFNPNTNELIIVPTQLPANDTYVLALSNMETSPTNPLLDAAGDVAGVSGLPFYASFGLDVMSVESITAEAVATGLVVAATVAPTAPVTLTVSSSASSKAVPAGPSSTFHATRPKRPAQALVVSKAPAGLGLRDQVTSSSASRWPVGPLGL